MRKVLAVSLIASALAGCVAPPPTSPPPAPYVTPTSRPTPPPPVPLSTDWNDWPFTAGDWQYRRSDGGTLAMFGTAQIMLRCDFAQRTIMLRVDGATGNIVVRATTITRSIGVDSDGRATLSASDPLFDAIAFSRGRFVIERTGQAPIVAPPYAEIGRVIEDCRG